MKREFMNAKPDPPARKGTDWEACLFGVFYFSVMLVWLSAVFVVICLLASLANAAPPDDVAVDFAVATMIEGKAPTPGPSPYDCPTCKDTGWIMHGDGHQTKCPNCDLAGLPGGPLDIIRQAKELIRKGNELANKGKALLDAIQKDGRITVDIRLPQATAGCPDGSCSVSNSTSAPLEIQGAEAGCPGGKCSNRTYPRKVTNSRMRIFKGWRR